MILWASSLEGEPQKPLVLLRKTDISEFWWFCEHSLLKGNPKNHQFYPAKLTFLSFDDSMSILSWRGTPKTISFTQQNWHFWFYEHSLLKGKPAVATLRAPPSAGGRFQFHAATKSCHSWGSVPPFWYLGEKHEGHEGAWNQIFIDSGTILGSTPIKKPLVFHSKTDILKISISRKRILESRN